MSPIIAAAAALMGVSTALVGFGGSVAAAPADGDPTTIERVVTLGDSYSSGVGLHADASDYDDHGPERHSFDADTRLGHSACHRETDTTYGAQLADTLHAEQLFIACAGAVVDEIPAQVEAADIPGTGAGTVVALTIGGNDLRTERGEDWPDVILRCVIEAGCDHDDDNQPANLSEIQAELDDTLQAIGEEHPDAIVRIMGYPRLMQRDRWGCLGMTGVGRGEADWVDDQVDLLNRRIRAAAATARTYTGADIRYVDVAERFDNHGACRVFQRDRYVNDSILGETYKRELDDDGNVVDVFADNWIHLSSSSVHPNQKGHDAYYDALVDSLPGDPHRAW